MKKALILLLILSFSGTICAKTKCAGIFNSPKGFGLSYATRVDSDEFNSFALYADIYGLISGKCDYPGVRFNYSHLKVVKVWKKEDLVIAFYVGPGATIGFVRDYEKGYYNLQKTVFTQNYGTIAALSGTTGFRFLFSGRISLDLSWTADFGLHLRKDENVDTYQLRFYRNGLFTAFYPQLKLEYFF